jgi:CTP:molybdopterin cytidylyltransferase MocA
MPSYNTQPMPTPKPALYTGDQIALVSNAAVDAGILATLQVAIAPAPGDTATYCTVFNGTNQSVQMQAAPSDSAALYQSLGSSIAAGALATISCAVPWVRGLFATAPTTGSLVIYHG